MARVLAMLFISMVVSGYYFPFSFAVLPQLNTKMALAMTGVFLVVLQGCRRHKISFSKELLGAIIFAFVFSFICFIAADYNHTDDYSYVTYFISFFTWLGGAFVVCFAIKSVNRLSDICMCLSMHIGYFDRPVSGIPTFSRYLCLPGTGIFSGSEEVVWHWCCTGSCRSTFLHCIASNSLPFV